MKKKVVAEVLAFLLIFAALFVQFNRVYTYKYNDGITQMSDFYNLDNNTVGVLFMGTSHVYINVNPMVLWQDYGIASYDLAGSVAPMWSTYHYLKEAIKTQSPKLVVLDLYGLTMDYEYMDDTRIIKNLYGMKPSINKWEAFIDSTPSDQRAQILLSYIMYHNRYAELDDQDFTEALWLDSGYDGGMGHVTSEAGNVQIPREVINDGTVGTIPKKQQQYFEMIIDFCEHHDITLKLIVSPYAEYSYGDAIIYNAAEEIAGKHNLSILNMNEDFAVTGLDWSIDYVDECHMNWIGSAKYTRYLGAVLDKEYKLVNHQSDEKYKAWNQAYAFYANALVRYGLHMYKDAEGYYKYISTLPENYVVITRNYSSMLDDFSSAVNVTEAGKSQDYIENEYGYIWSSGKGEYELTVDADGIYWMDDNIQVDISDGNVVVVYDRLNKLVADSVAIDVTGYVNR